MQFEQGPVGRPRMVLLSLEYISSLLDLNLSIPCIAALLGVSRRTVYFEQYILLPLLFSDCFISICLWGSHNKCIIVFMTDPSVFSLQKKSSVIDIYCFRLEWWKLIWCLFYFTVLNILWRNASVSRVNVQCLEQIHYNLCCFCKHAFPIFGTK